MGHHHMQHIDAPENLVHLDIVAYYRFYSVSIRHYIHLTIDSDAIEFECHHHMSVSMLTNRTMVTSLEVFFVCGSKKKLNDECHIKTLMNCKIYISNEQKGIQKIRTLSNNHKILHISYNQ